MVNFWQKLPKPFFLLAPMEDVTDTVFRQVVAGVGKPDVFFTEFVNVDGLCSRGRDKLIHRLKYSEVERPIVAQIWGMQPENFYKVSQELVKMGFDGIDINFGCPEKNVISQGACVALIENRSLAKEIILATLEGAKGKPVSIKTRIGIKQIVTEDWISFLLQFNLAAITIHGRTAKELSDVPAHWDEIGKAVVVRDTLFNKNFSNNPSLPPLNLRGGIPPLRLRGGKWELENANMKTLIIGNGDVVSLTEALEKVKQFGVDGVMIGRGIFHNPWVFNKSQTEHSVRDKLELLLKHSRLFIETWGNSKNFSILKKFFKIYCSSFPGASELRVKLMHCDKLVEVEKLVQEHLHLRKNPQVQSYST